MNIFLLLILVHLLVDFLQPASLVKWSKEKTVGTLTHATVYAILCIVVLYQAHAWYFWVFILSLSHFLLDHTKFVLARRYGQTGLFLFLLDQILHVLIILLVTICMINEGVKSTVFLDYMGDYSRMLPILVGLITVTFGVSIMIFEANRTYFQGENSGIGSVVLFKDRMAGIIERSIATVFMLTSFYYLIPVSFVYSYYRLWTGWKKKTRGRLMFDLAISITSTIGVGIIVIIVMNTCS